MADNALDRLRDSISGERRDWHKVEVRPDDIAAVLAIVNPAPTVCHDCGGDGWHDPQCQAEPARPDALREAAQAVVDEWDESLRLWLAAGEEEDDDGPAMTAIRDPERETRRRANEAALRAALAGKEPTDG